MPLIFRVITRSRWYRNSALSWLASDDIPADSLLDLRTAKNTLSIFVIEDDLSNLERVIAAFAAKRQDIDSLDYSLMDMARLQNLGFQFADTRGDTPDNMVNLWHRDIVELSAKKLVVLAILIFEESKKDRALPKSIRELLMRGLSAGWFKREDINSTLNQRLD